MVSAIVNQSSICFVILSFLTGIIFSEWNNSLLSLLVFLFLYEIVWYGLCRYIKYDWSGELRILYLCAFLVGWLIGRIYFISNEDE